MNFYVANINNFVICEFSFIAVFGCQPSYSLVIKNLQIRVSGPKTAKPLSKIYVVDYVKPFFFIKSLTATLFVTLVVMDSFYFSNCLHVHFGPSWPLGFSLVLSSTCANHY